jgi:hypothetical protein
MLARAGCRTLFVGLESFNPTAIADMNKHQNAIPKIRAALEHCRDNGILVMAGLMVSPLVDDLAYIGRIPGYLRRSGLHVPTFICFECPIPGTPHFQRLARLQAGPFLPNALLRDFTGYTLVLKPAHAAVAEYIAAYRKVIADVYSWRNRIRKLADDLPRFLKRGRWLPALFDLADVCATDPTPAASRTLVAGTDTEPQERVPFDESDFSSDVERARILSPWVVTDGDGRVLDRWLESPPVYSQPTAAARAAERKLAVSAA